MKRWHYFVLAAALAAGGVYLYTLQGAALGDLVSSVWGRPGGVSSGGNQWHKVERPGDGFKVDLPGEDKDLQVPAYNEKGGSEPVHMLAASPNGDVTYAVSWLDNPPVARVSHSVDRTLYMARDGMLTRTATSIVSETRGVAHDYPSLDVLARNGSGGILNARLIMAENRLYILFAMFPSSSAHREKDVKRFFDSFVPAHPSGIPESIPVASQR